MEKIRYYYSVPTYTVNVQVVDDHRGGFNVNKILRYSPTTIKPVPRITICSILDTETMQMAFGIARCNPSDSFCRKIGREISYQNAKKNPIYVATAPETDIGKWRVQICRELEEK
jgi:hypothetical protein